MVIFSKKNHYIDGLIPLLKVLATNPEIKTIVPGEIKRSKGRSKGLKIKITTETLSGYKLIAKDGNTVQEIFVSTKLNRLRLEKLVDKIN